MQGFAATGEGRFEHDHLAKIQDGIVVATHALAFDPFDDEDALAPGIADG